LKPAEFTDHASAAAFLAAGRKKGERATSDGWNTVLYDRGSTLVLELHGTPVVTYSPSGETTIDIPMRNHVVADRVQRYGLADKFQLNTVGNKWALSQAWRTLPGINDAPIIWYPVLADVPAAFTINGGAVTSHSVSPMPPVLSRTDRKSILALPEKRWRAKAMKMMDAGWTFTGADMLKCVLCTNYDEGQIFCSSIGQMSGDTTHLISHVLEGVVLPSTVLTLVAEMRGVPYTGVTGSISGGTMGSVSPAYNRDMVARYLKAALRPITY
jgi:hypothetical protein